MSLTSFRSRLRAHTLELLPLPLALLGAISIAMALATPLALVVSAAVLHQPHLGHHLRDHSTPWLLTRQALRLGLLAALLLALPALGSAAGWLPAVQVPAHQLLQVIVAALVLYGLLFITLRTMLRRGHFATRLAVVGPPAAAASVVTHLRENQRHLFQILGVYDEREPEDLRQLQELGQREWLDVIVVARPAAPAECPPELRHQLRHLSAPVALVTPTAGSGQWLLVDDLDLEAFTPLAAAFGHDRYGFVVTPNADHLIRLQDDPAFRKSYGNADFVLLDSRFLARWLRWTRRRELRVCPGSDLTAALFDQVIASNDRLLMVGGTAEQARRLRQRYGLRDLQQHMPPMGFIHDPAAIRECLEFIEQRSPFRFCLLAVGAPQQEQIAALLKERGVARGLTLCIGASLNFLTGGEQRAPRWMQGMGVEWLYRLLQNPRRLAGRYLWRGPRVFSVLARRSIGVRKHLFTVTAATPDGRTHRSDTSLPANRRRTG